MSNLEKSILVVAIAEYFSQITPYEIAIAEAVKQVEKLGSYRAHTYVNRVLELIFREKMN
ncbi:MAG: transcription antitermination factor NusB [Mollicutes bacterium]|nr:MAG: transcription antitermination factor NusB [Mollicutes bacterium]